MSDNTHQPKWRRFRSVQSISNLWESLAKEDMFECPKVDLQVLYPNAMACQQVRYTERCTSLIAWLIMLKLHN